MKRRIPWLLGALALAALALSLADIFLLGRYAMPAADDFGYGAPVHFALEAGLGPAGVLGAVWESLRYTYEHWQGTFSSVLLFTLQPGAFSEAAYPLTVPVMLAAVMAPPFLALAPVRMNGRGWKLLLGSVAALVSVQFLPSPAQGFYWWNGAAHYLAFWCLGVGMAVCQVCLGRGERGGRGLALRLIPACLGCFFQGGGNYSTALVFVLASAALTLWAALERRPRPALLVNVLMTLSAAAGLLVSVAAPGNAVRQAGLQRGLPPLEAVLASFRAAGEDALAMTGAPLLAALALCVPVFLLAVRGRGYTFPMPLMVVGGGFCAFAALYTPPLYAMGASAVPRMENLFWLAWVFLVLGGGCYLAGWISVHLPAWRRAGPVLAALGCAGGVLLAAALGTCWEDTCAHRARADLESPVLETYLRERAERRALAEDHRTPPPRFTPMSGYPQCFPVSQLLTWCSDVLVDGAPADLPCYHACGGEVTYVGLDRALAFFGREGALAPEDFSARFRIGGETCVPLRELCQALGFTVGYDQPSDTIAIDTGP